ncbi:tetratricopeptide repeat protein [Actinosynnema sp. NPDC049800]
MARRTTEQGLRLRRDERSGKHVWRWSAAAVFVAGAAVVLTQAPPADLGNGWTGSAPQVSAAAATCAMVVALLTFVCVQVRETRKERRERRARESAEWTSLREHIHLFVDGRCPTVREVTDHAAVGVTRSLDLPGAGGAAAYVPRDLDEKLVALLKESAFTLLLGESKAGKTRTAFEAVRAAHPDRALVVPRTPGSLDELISLGVDFGDCVVWLDDLDRYLGAGGVSLQTITALTAGTCRVVATMRNNAKRVYAPVNGQDGPEWRVIRQAESRSLERVLTEGELDRMAAVLPHVPPSALADRGLAEYLSAARDLVDRFDDAASANPCGHHLVLAAVDLMRCGLRVPTTADVFAVARAIRPATEPEWSDDDLHEALRWACEAVYGTSALVRSADTGLRVFDYLVDEVDARRQDVRDEAWEFAGAVTGEAERVDVLRAAIAYERVDVLVPLCRRLATSPDPTLAGNALYNLAIHERRGGDRAEALRLLRESQALDFPFAYHREAVWELRAKHWRKADRLAEKAFKLGDRDVASMMGHHAMRRNDMPRARLWLARAADQGNRDCLRHLVGIEAELGASPTARTRIEEAARDGDPFSRLAFAEILMHEGRRRASRALLRDLPSDDEAYQRHAMFIGRIHAGTGSTAKALEWYRLAVARGVEAARVDLAMLLLKRPGEAGEAWDILQGEAAAGSRKAKRVLAREAVRRRDWAEAERWLVELAGGDDLRSTHDLARLYEVTGRLDEAEKHFRRAFKQGHHHCADHVAVLVLARRGYEEARTWLERVARGSTSIARVVPLIDEQSAPLIARIVGWQFTPLGLRVQRLLWSSPLLGRVLRKVTETMDVRLSDVKLVAFHTDD